MNVKLTLPLPILLSLFLCSFVQANPKFNVGDVVGGNSDLMLCDLDGDRLSDLVLMDEMNLSIFYQDHGRSFTREPQQTYRLDHPPSAVLLRRTGQPCIVWAARLGGQAASLLVMTSDGVTELRFANRTGAPALRRIISQPTIVPNAATDTNAMQLPLSVETGRAWPLLLVPTEDGLQVWEHRDDWRPAQVIGHFIDARLRPSVADPGYDASLGLSLGVGDVNGDGRADLTIRRNQLGRTNTYSLHLQQTNGLFAPEPTLTYADKTESHSWLCWVDLNRDGKVDLLKSIWLNEPSFVPGFASGKVLVSTFIADALGRIPPTSQQVFRKNDWTPSLPVMDVDGDGFLDLALGYSFVDSREGVRKTITAKQLDFSFRIHFYRAGVGFPKEADCQRDVVIHLDETNLLLGQGRRKYFERFVKLEGDFNGDGKTDLLVRDRSDEISVYFFVSRAKGFSPKPDLQFRCPPLTDEWQVTDLNHDRISDLIIKPADQKGLRTFISEK